MTPQRALRAGMALASVFLSAETNAADSETSGGVSSTVASFEVVEGCPTEASFVARVRERTSGSGDRGTRVRVRVEAGDAAPASFIGTIEVHEPGHGASLRTIHAASCVEAVEALSFIAAMSLDRKRDEARPADGDPPRESATRSSASPLERTPPATPSDPALAGPEKDFTSKDDERHRVAVAVGVDTVAQGGVGPEPLLTVPPYVDVALASARSRRAVDFRLAPAFRLGFARGAADATVERGGTAGFRWTAGMFDICPVIAERGVFAFRPCIRLELGTIEAEGKAIAAARAETKPWVALAIPARLRVSASRIFFFEVEAGPRLALARERFVFQPDVTVFRPPAIAWFAGVGAGVAFP